MLCVKNTLYYLRRAWHSLHVYFSSLFSAPHLSALTCQRAEEARRQANAHWDPPYREPHLPLSAEHTKRWAKLIFRTEQQDEVELIEIEQATAGEKITFSHSSFELIFAFDSLQYRALPFIDMNMTTTMRLNTAKASLTASRSAANAIYVVPLLQVPPDLIWPHLVLCCLVSSHPSSRMH